jgi:acyl carrier protein
MNVAGTEVRICSLIRRVSKRPTAEPQLPLDADLFRELGVESTAALDLLFSLEDEFGVALPDEAYSAARTIRKLTALVDSLRGTP